MKHTYSLVHLTNIACSPPAFIRTAAAAGYDAVSLRTIPMGLPGEVPHDITDRKLRAETLAACQETGVWINDTENARIDDGVDVHRYEPHLEAAAELGASDRIHVVDSQSLSTGIGLLVMEAAVMAQEGKSAKEIVAHVTSLIPLVRASFVVDTLTFLHRGGRCSGAAALMGSMLKLHPKIVVRDGQMLVDKKYRGSLARCIPAYTHDLHDDLLRARPERVFITHSGCDPEVVEQVRTYLTSLNYFDAVIETRAGGVISCHCGPGTLGVLFILKE